jgi:hypothetical protein
MKNETISKIEMYAELLHRHVRIFASFMNDLSVEETNEVNDIILNNNPLPDLNELSYNMKTWRQSISDQLFTQRIAEGLKDKLFKSESGFWAVEMKSKFIKKFNTENEANEAFYNEYVKN